MIRKRNSVNNRTTKYYYVRNPNVEKGDCFVNFTLNVGGKMRFSFFFVSSADG